MTRSGWQNESGGSQHSPCRRLVARPSPQTRFFPPAAETPVKILSLPAEARRIATR
jgi:hypothetical protein